MLESEELTEAEDNGPVKLLSACTSLSRLVASVWIWVNAVVPSIMDTPMNRQAMPKAEHDKWPKVSEVAATIAFLASPQNQVTRGALVPVYGRS